MSLCLYSVFINILWPTLNGVFFFTDGKANIVQLLSLVGGTIHVNYTYNSV